MFQPAHARRAEGPIVDPDDTLGAPSGLALLRQGSAAAGANANTTGGTTAFEDLFPSYVAMRRGAGAGGGNDGSPRRDSAGGPPMRALPRVPFYGLLRKLQVDVGLPDAAPGLAESPTKAHRAERPGRAGDEVNVPQGIGIPPQDVSGARVLSTLELDDIVSRCCGYFRYGNRGHLRDLAGDSGEGAAVSGSRTSGGGTNAAASRPSATLSAAALVDRRERYARYVDAACDAYRQFRAPYLARRARSRHSGNTGIASAAAAATQSLPFRGFYFICHDHPRWKTFAAMFFEESPGEQQVVVASESASLQTFLSQACVDVGADADQLEWLDGALLLSTGSRFGHDGTDPIEAVFDALLNIQDATMPSRVAGDAFNPNGTAAAGVGAAQAFDRACGQSGMNGLVPATSLPDVPLIADYVTVLSPVPFRGGEWQHFRAHKVQNNRTGSIATAQASWLLGDVRGVGDVLLPSAVQSLSTELTQLGVSFSLFFTTLSPNAARGRGSAGPGKLQASGRGNVSGAGRVMHAVQRDRPQADVGTVFGEAKVTAVAPWLTFSRLSAQEWLSFADVAAAKVAEEPRRDEDDDGGGDDDDSDAVDAIFTPVCLQVWPELSAERRCYVQSSVLKLF